MAKSSFVLSIFGLVFLILGLISLISLIIVICLSSLLLRRLVSLICSRRGVVPSRSSSRSLVRRLP
jgi:hypothetical protein